MQKNKNNMKYLKLFTIVLFSFGSISNAQSNVAHIDSQALISKMLRFLKHKLRLKNFKNLSIRN